MIPGEVGGCETYLRECIASLVECDDITKLTLLTQNENHALFMGIYGDNDKVSCLKLNLNARNRAIRIIAEQFNLVRVVRDCGAELLWSPGYTAPLRKLSCPQVVTIHDMQYRRFPEDISWLYRLASDLLIPSAAKCCNAVIADSLFGKEEVIKYCKVPDDKISVVYAGCNNQFGVPLSDQYLRKCLDELNLKANGFVLCVAHTHPHKCVHNLVDAFAAIKRLDLRLVLVGKTRRGEIELQQSIARHSINKQVTRLETVDQSMLTALYQSCAVFVLPSQYEGFGLPVLEALTAGAPVITTRSASLPEVGGESVVYVNNTTQSLSLAIESVLNRSNKERRHYASKGKQWAAGFSWNKTGDELCALFKKVICKQCRI